MSTIDKLEKRVEHLEAEVKILEELIQLQNKFSFSKRSVPTYLPPKPWNPYFSKEPPLEPPYKITCGGEE